MSRAADLWDIIKYTNIYLMGLPEGEERVKRAERMFEEIISESFPNLIKKLHSEEIQQIPRHTQTHHR